jgi:hypothetical protein
MASVVECMYRSIIVTGKWSLAKATRYLRRHNGWWYLAI